MKKHFKNKYRFINLALILAIANLHVITASSCLMQDEHECTAMTECKIEEQASSRNDHSCCEKENPQNDFSQTQIFESSNNCNCFHLLENNIDMILTKVESKLLSVKLIATLLPQTQSQSNTKNYSFTKEVNHNPQSIPIYLSSNSFLI